MFQETTQTRPFPNVNIHVWGLSEAREYQEKTNYLVMQATFELPWIVK